MSTLPNLYVHTDRGNQTIATFVQMEEVRDEGGKEGEDITVNIRPSRMPSPLKLTVIVVVVLLTLTSALGIIMGVLYGVNRNSSSSSSSSYFDLSDRIQGAMNEDTDPCEDFYNFTCGNWSIYNNITPGV